MFKKFKKNNLIIINQIKNKVLSKSWHSLQLVRLIHIQVNLNKLKSFDELLIGEGLLLLEFITKLRSSITYSKKMYQEVNVKISNEIRKSCLLYFLLLLKIFYFPVLIRRNEAIVSNYDKLFKFSLTLMNINILPFIPDIFFKWITPICCYFNLLFFNKNNSYLFLRYWNFPLY
jgi:hypothetical protein